MKIIGCSFEKMILNISLELKTIWTIPTYFILASKILKRISYKFIGPILCNLYFFNYKGNNYL